MLAGNFQHGRHIIVFFNIQMILKYIKSNNYYRNNCNENRKTK